MKTAAFIILPEKGHINPYIGPAQALQQQGWSVVVASVGPIQEQIKKAGLQFSPDLLSNNEPLQPMSGKALVDLIQNTTAMSEWIKSLLLTVEKEDVQKHLHFIKSSGASVVIVDPLAYAAVIAAELSGVPWVSMSNSLNPVLESDVESDLLKTLKKIHHQRANLFKSYNVNVEFNGCDALSNHLTIAFCTPEFVGARNTPVHMLGPSLPVHFRGDEIPIHKSTDRPFIYASFGSQIYHWPTIFERLMKATENFGYDLVLSAGDLAENLKAPSHVKIYKYAPQLQLLEKASAFITHGGANSVMEAIACNVPVWITPMCNDQFHQAHYIRKARIGIVQDIQKCSTEQIRNALIQLLENQEIKNNMDRISKSYQTNGATESARLIAGLL